jgi:hypothetical protein
MRKPFLFSSLALLTLGLLTAAPSARACDEDDDGPNCASSNDDVKEYQWEPGIAIGLDVLHGAGDMGALGGSSDSTWGVRTSMHTRLGKRVGIRIGLEESMGGDAAGYKRWDLGWELPDIYLYLTPTSKFQLYTVLGMDMRVEHFESGRNALSDQVAWGQFYLGAIMGAGIETRLSKMTGLRFELRGFVRGRAQDSGAEQDLRAADETFANATKTQKGVIFSAGMIFF